jgi:inosine-uridine nucleoside N-ribohydrolase
MGTSIRTRAILDVDTGTDDAVALLLAAKSYDLDLIGVTVVVGNCPCVVATENTLRVFDAAGVAGIPVYPGMDVPLGRPDFARTTPHFQDAYLPLPQATSRAQMESAGDIMLVPVGPLTNIATAMRLAPQIVEKIPHMVIMGGGHALANASPSAEFNIWADPEAAKIVFNAKVPISLLPLDATNQAPVSEKEVERLRTLDTRAARIAADMSSLRLQASRGSRLRQRPGTPLHDAIAVCALIDPSIIQTELVHVDVEVSGDLTVGRTVCDFQQCGTGVPNVDVAVWADESRFHAMLEAILGQPDEQQLH